MKTTLIRLAAVAGVLMVAASAGAQEPIVEGGCYGGDCYGGYGAACYDGRCHQYGLRGMIPGVARLHEAWPYNPDNWHGRHYHTSYGAPVALVTPPNMSNQTKWAWGVGNTASVPVYNQFSRNYPGPAVPGGWGAGYAPAPRWPSSTDQFGVYYVRGPW